jgi:hypothetical protein
MGGSRARRACPSQLPRERRARAEVRRRSASQVVEPDAPLDAGAREGARREALAVALLGPAEVVVFTVPAARARREHVHGADGQRREVRAEHGQEPGKHGNPVRLLVLLDHEPDARAGHLDVEIQVGDAQGLQVSETQPRPDRDRVHRPLGRRHRRAREQPIDLLGAEPVVGQVDLAPARDLDLGGRIHVDQAADRGSQRAAHEPERMTLRLRRDRLARLSQERSGARRDGRHLRAASEPDREVLHVGARDRLH